MFYVHTGTKKPYPHNWRLVSEHSSLVDAEAAAEKLCPRGCEIDTEPGFGLEKSFFGSRTSEIWSAMILTEKDENYIVTP